MNLKALIKRGALLALANWPVVAIQFLAESTFQALLAVPIIGAAILVGVLLGTDFAEVARGGLRDIFTTVTDTVGAEPVALGAFITAFVVMLFGGSILMFLVKGGTIEVLRAAERAIGTVEDEPVTVDVLQRASCFSLERFATGCTRLFRPYLGLGIVLMASYAVSGGLYVAFVVYVYRTAEGLIFGWTAVAALAAAVLMVWITLINFVYLLIQIAIAVDGLTLGLAVRTVRRFIVARFRSLAGMFLVVLALVVTATFVSALAWSGVGLIAFVPVVGLAVVPFQLVALLARGLLFEYHRADRRRRVHQLVSIVQSGDLGTRPDRLRSPREKGDGSRFAGVVFGAPCRATGCVQTRRASRASQSRRPSWEASEGRWCRPEPHCPSAPVW